MYHIFIHSSVDGHLSCFHVLAVDLKYSHYEKEIFMISDGMKVLVNAMVVFILQYIKVSNQYIIYLIFTQFYMSIMSQ